MKERTALKRVIAAPVLTALLFTVAAGQSPRQPRPKLSADEILNRGATDCYTHVSYEDEELDEHLNECLNIRKVPVQGLLADFLEWWPTPLGFVPAAFGEAHDRRDFNPTGMSVRDMLDAIVAADSRYRWCLEDGVINLLPAAGRPPLLDVRLAEFKGEGYVGDLFQALKKSPEVRRRAAELGFDTERPSDEANGFIISLWANTPAYEIHCRDCTVMEVLNEIARQSGASWMYQEVNFDGKRDFYFSSISSTE